LPDNLAGHRESTAQAISPIIVIASTTLLEDTDRHSRKEESSATGKVTFVPAEKGAVIHPS
jgi:hypothetical protein